MTAPSSSVLEFPAMLHGPEGTVDRQMSAQGKRWAREYVETGGFIPPKRMLPVSPGEPMLMHAMAEFEFMCRPDTWRPHLFANVFMYLHLGVPREQRPRMEESFEIFCRSTPWGALYHAVAPPPPWSAERMAQRFAALLRFWDVLQGPRYTYRLPNTLHTLDGLVDAIYRPTLDTWLPGGPASVREHLTLTVERMTRATHEECLDAVLRVIPVLVSTSSEFKHPERLKDPAFLRERLAALPPGDFEDLSAAYKFKVFARLLAWDRQLTSASP